MRPDPSATHPGVDEVEDLDLPLRESTG
jgi:hypothetical protein